MNTPARLSDKGRLHSALPHCHGAAASHLPESQKTRPSTSPLIPALQLLQQRSCQPRPHPAHILPISLCQHFWGLRALLPCDLTKHINGIQAIQTQPLASSSFSLCLADSKTDTCCDLSAVLDSPRSQMAQIDATVLVADLSLTSAKQTSCNGIHKADSLTVL